MAIYQELINFNDVFAKLKEPPIIVNDVAFSTDEEKEELMEQYLTTYSSDKISTVPSCDCGVTKGEYAIGSVCPECNTRVRSSTLEDIEPILWFRKPYKIEKLINPIFWIMLKDKFTNGKFCVLSWVCDTKYENTAVEPSAKAKEIIEELKGMGIVRGYNNFVKNFDEIISMLLATKGFRAKNKEMEFLYELIQNNRERLFSDYIPLPNKMLIVLEKQRGVSEFEDGSVTAADAFNAIAGIDKKITEFNLTTRMDRTIRSIDKLCTYYQFFYGRYLASKESISRHHIYSTRCHFSFRAVIISITGPHEYDELYIPWGVACGLLKIHLVNKLFTYGYDYNQALSFIYGHIHKYHPLIAQMLDEIIDESPDKSIHTLFNRNPSLLMGSVQRMRVTRVKKDPSDTTISMPILATVPYNADFDGKFYCCH